MRASVVIIGGLEHDYELRDFLSRADQPYRVLGADEGRGVLERHGLDGGRLPVSLEELGDALGVRRPPRRTDYDLVVVGAGPAGLAAAVYAASDGLSVVVAERTIAGGQAGHTSRIENYFGVDPAGPPMTGARLSRIGVSQAEAFGAELVPLRAVVDADILDDGRHEVELSTGEKLRGSAVIIASGVDWRRLEVAGIDDFLGRGVFYGAGRSEAPLLGGRHVAVVGAGNSAAQAALDLALHCDRVTMIVRGRRLSGSLSGYLCARIEGDPRIYVRLETEVTAVAGDGRLEAITLNAGEVLPADALIVSIGGKPRTHWAAEHNLVIDEGGYLVTGHDLLEHGRLPRSWGLERPPLALEASVPGVFVAGDIRHGSIKRVASAAGEGATAVGLIHRYLSRTGG